MFSKFSADSIRSLLSSKLRTRRSSLLTALARTLAPNQFQSLIQTATFSSKFKHVKNPATKLVLRISKIMRSSEAFVLSSIKSKKKSTRVSRAGEGRTWENSNPARREKIPNQGSQALAIQQACGGSFSAVAKPISEKAHLATCFQTLVSTIIAYFCSAPNSN